MRHLPGILCQIVADNPNPFKEIVPGEKPGLQPGNSIAFTTGSGRLEKTEGG
jgi:hypothetical protein